MDVSTINPPVIHPLIRKDLIPGLDTVLAITVKQPWASLLVSGIKTIETRTWRPSYPMFSKSIHRGHVLICASKKPDFGIRDLPNASIAHELAMAVWGRHPKPGEELPNGMALGVAELVDDWEMTETDERAACCAVYPKAKCWGFANAYRIKPFPVRGKLGFFPVPIESARQLERI